MFQRSLKYQQYLTLPKHSSTLDVHTAQSSPWGLLSAGMLRAAMSLSKLMSQEYIIVCYI